MVYPLADLEVIPDRPISDIDAETKLFQHAIQSARNDIINLGEKLSANLPEQEQALFDAFLAILDDSGIGHEVVEEIQKGNWAQGALRKVIQNHVRHFESLDDDYFSERAADIRDLGLRVLSYLQDEQQTEIEYASQTILVGEEISASALAEVPEGRLAGIVSVNGSINSHVAILARALGIPAVMGLEGLSLHKMGLESKTIIVDGYYGQVYISPSPELRQEFEILVQEERELNTNLSDLRNEPAVTPDGHNISCLSIPD